MNHVHTNHRSDPLPVLVLAAMLGALPASTAGAEEAFLDSPNLADLEDGDIKLARLGHSSSAVHMSFMSPSLEAASGPDRETAAVSTDTLPDVYLSLRLSW